MQRIKLTKEASNKIRPLHGVNCAPHGKASGTNQPLTKKIFEYCGIPHSRTHDCMGSYGGCYYIDVPNIFRDFDADENNPENYDFHYSDEYIKSIVNSGAQIIYRLGVTIEWGTKQYTSHPPKDFAKWARICEHIIMHYNKGWCNGYNFNIEYWEIWNEPENPPMWTGTREQFYELYKVSSIYLKEKFPEIKIGGYGSCGFYAVFRDGLSDFYKSFIPYFEDFLIMCKENNCPLDFYTWHIYTGNISEIEKSQHFVKELLDKYGFAKTESHLNEWNYGGEGQGFDKLATMVGASFCASALICMQECGIDLSQYYCLNRLSSYNGFIELRTAEFTPVIHVFAAFNKLFNASNEVLCVKSSDAPDILCAGNEIATTLLISNYKKNNTDFVLDLSMYAGKQINLYKLSEANGFEAVAEQKISSELSVSCDEKSVFYAVIYNNEEDIKDYLF